MIWSYLPRWKFTDSCGRPMRQARFTSAAPMPATPHVTTQRGATFSRPASPSSAPRVLYDSRSARGVRQVRVFPPPPPAVSPIAGLMDTHVHAAPDVFGRSLDDEEMAILYKERGLEGLVLKNHVTTTADRAWFAASTSRVSKCSAASC